MGKGPGGKWRPRLPDGYWLDEATDHDLVILRREDGSEAAAFGERASIEEVERAAWEDHGRWGQNVGTP